MKVIVELTTAEEIRKLSELFEKLEVQVAPEAEPEKVPEEPKAEVEEPPKAETVQEEVPAINGNMTPVEALNIPPKLVKILHEKHIDTITDLTKLRERDLKDIPQIGQASLRVIKGALRQRKLRLRRRDYKGVG